MDNMDDLKVKGAATLTPIMIKVFNHLESGKSIKAALEPLGVTTEEFAMFMLYLDYVEKEAANPENPLHKFGGEDYSKNMNIVLAFLYGYFTGRKQNG